MKLLIRLLLTVPLLFVTYIYVRYHDPDEVCSGMMEIFFEMAIMICSLLALLAIFLRRKGKKLMAEPVSLIICSTAVLTAIFASIFPGHTTGKVWIEAKSPGAGYSVYSKTLILKHNGNFTLKTFGADFGCTISGSFKKAGDTIFFDDKSIELIGTKADTAYTITKNKLTPINGKDASREFVITAVK